MQQHASCYDTACVLRVNETLLFTLLHCLLTARCLLTAQARAAAHETDSHTRKQLQKTKQSAVQPHAQSPAASSNVAVLYAAECTLVKHQIVAAGSRLLPGAAATADRQSKSASLLRMQPMLQHKCMYMYA